MSMVEGVNCMPVSSPILVDAPLKSEAVYLLVQYA